MNATHGVFDGYLHRSLVWHRSESKDMEPIIFPSDRTVPSWSWMSQTGKIAYMHIPYYEVEWSQNIQLNDGMLQVEVRPLQSCRIEFEDGETYLKQRHRSHGKARVQFDGGSVRDMETLQCVILGRDRMPEGERTYYVLLVTPESTGRDHAFERAGLGYVPEALICFQDEAIPTYIV
jgi:hypothetical protein